MVSLRNKFVKTSRTSDGPAVLEEEQIDVLPVWPKDVKSPMMDGDDYVHSYFKKHDPSVTVEAIRLGADDQVYVVEEPNYEYEKNIERAINFVEDAYDDFFAAVTPRMYGFDDVTVYRGYNETQILTASSKEWIVRFTVMSFGQREHSYKTMSDKAFRYFFERGVAGEAQEAESNG